VHPISLNQSRMTSCGRDCECLYKLLDLRKPPDTIQVLKSSVIKAQYKKFMRMIHPDKTDDPRSHITAVLLNQSLAILNDRAMELDYRLNGLAFVNNHKHTVEEFTKAIEFLHESIEDSIVSGVSGKPVTNRPIIRRRSRRVQERERGKSSRESDAEPISSTSKSLEKETEKSTAPTNEADCRSPAMQNDIQQSSGVNSYKFKSRTSSQIDEPRSIESPFVKLSKLWTLKYRAQNPKREIARIVDHNIRPTQVYFIVEWATDKSQDLIKAESLVIDNDYRVTLYAYLERVRLNAPSRFDYLVKKAPILWDLYDINK